MGLGRGVGQGLERWRLLPSLSSGILALAAVASLGGLAFAALEGWPIWASGLAAVLPWLPVFVRKLAWMSRQYQWLALFYGLVVTQTGHFLEHVAQMTQIHLLGLTGPDARGVFGALDIEWVHFVWNTWVLLAVLVLLARFGTNRWLWLVLLLSAWHELEHAYIFSVYLTTGASGNARAAVTRRRSRRRPADQSAGPALCLQPDRDGPAGPRVPGAGAAHAGAGAPL